MSNVDEVNYIALSKEQKVDIIQKLNNLSVIHKPRFNDAFLAELKHQDHLLRERKHLPPFEHELLKSIVYNEHHRALRLPKNLLLIIIVNLASRLRFFECCLEVNIFLQRCHRHCYILSHLVKGLFLILVILLCHLSIEPLHYNI